MYLCIGMDDQTWYNVKLILACIPWVVAFVVLSSFVLSYLYSLLFLYHVENPAGSCDVLPGISIIKPLMGEEEYLQHNLETHFNLEYPEFELLFCVQNEKDPVLQLVYNLQQKYSHVNSKVFIGGKGILNPLVDNMAPAYEACQYELVWICTSRVKVSTNVLIDMVGKISKPEVALVHQIPFTSDQPGLAAAIEKIYFGTVVPRYYFSSQVLGIVCFTGMSYLVKKSELDLANGLPWYGKYMAEDFFLAKALRDRGFRHRLSAIPAQQNVASQKISSFTDRMIRWQKLRINMLPLIGGIMEPLGESIPLCLYMSWSMWFFFETSPVVVFFVSICLWCILDYIQLRGIQRDPLPFGPVMYTVAWTLRQILFLFIYVRALSNVRNIKWGGRTYRLSNFGRSLDLAPRRGIMPI